VDHIDHDLLHCILETFKTMLCNVFLNMGMHKLDFGDTLVYKVNMAARRVPPRHTMNRGAIFLSMVCYK